MTDEETAATAFAYNCRDCGFIGTWVTVDGCCPECNGRDLPTQPSRRGDRVGTEGGR